MHRGTTTVELMVSATLALWGIGGRHVRRHATARIMGVVMLTPVSVSASLVLRRGTTPALNAKAALAATLVLTAKLQVFLSLVWNAT